MNKYNFESNIDEKLTQNKSLINFQNNEILKAKNLLLIFENNFIIQKEALKNLIEERSCLENEITKRKCIEEEIKLTLARKEISKLRRRNPDTLFCNELKSKDIDEPPNKKRLCLTKKGVKCDIMNPLIELLIPNIKDHVIFKLTHANGVIVCCNGGLLLRYTKLEIHTYQMKTNEDIFHIEVVKFQKRIFLVSFTKDTVYIMDIYRFKTCHSIRIFLLYEAYIKSVVNDGNVIFITLTNGLIKRVVRDNWKISDNPIYNHNFFLASLNCKYCLTVKDSKLYKSAKRDLINLEEVHGVLNVKVVLRMESNKFICYSNDTIWFLNAICHITGFLTFESGIKFVDRHNVFAVLCENNNTIHVYNLKSGRFKKKICERKVTENIKALTIWEKNVYVAIEDRVLTFRFDDGKYTD